MSLMDCAATDVAPGAVFAHALAGEQVRLVRDDGVALPIPVQRWIGEPDRADTRMLDDCRGATLDVGCGPGRLAAELSRRGTVCLGVDVVATAVVMTRRRGGVALHRDVFEPLPGEGRWETVLLADGNVGIGGDPGLLLQRVRALLVSGGRAVVEVAPDAVGSRQWRGRLECACVRSTPFTWAVTNARELSRLAEQQSWRVLDHQALDGREWVVLESAR